MNGTIICNRACVRSAGAVYWGQRSGIREGRGMETIRRHIVFHGWVQGVGFRYYASHAAALCGATGWVRNEYDGSVTMEIQGTEAQIDRVILAIERGRYIRIENMETRTIPLLPDERGFRVR